jgi:hypothetical protein
MDCVTVCSGVVVVDAEELLVMVGFGLTDDDGDGAIDIDARGEVVDVRVGDAVGVMEIVG